MCILAGQNSPSNSIERGTTVASKTIEQRFTEMEAALVDLMQKGHAGGETAAAWLADRMPKAAAEPAKPVPQPASAPAGA